MTEPTDPLDNILRSAWNAAGPDSEEPTDDTAGKDTRDGNQPLAGASTLSSDVLDLLAAIRDALDVPLPGIEDRDEAQHRMVMFRRLSEVHLVLDVALDPRWIDTFSPALEAANIRKGTATTPVTYTVWQGRDGGEQA